ncbi:MAG: hypothetical protein WED81_01105 [Rhodothermales bacterium]
MEPLSQDIFIRTAYITALSAATFIVLLLFVITAWRIVTRVRFQRFVEVRTKWLDSLRDARTTIHADLGALPRDISFLLLHQWNAVFDQTRSTSDPGTLDTAQEQLRVAGDKVSMEEFALELLEDGTNEEIVSACVALGNLRASRAWIPLRRRIASDNAFVSASAAEALVRIDPIRATSQFIDGLCRHPDWPDHVLSRVFATLPESAVHDVIRSIAARGEFASVLRTFSALDRMGHEMSIVLLEWLLDHAKDEEALVECAYAAFQEKHVHLIADRLTRAHARLNPSITESPTLS